MDIKGGDSRYVFWGGSQKRSRFQMLVHSHHDTSAYHSCLSLKMSLTHDGGCQVVRSSGVNDGTWQKEMDIYQALQKEVTRWIICCWFARIRHIMDTLGGGLFGYWMTSFIAGGCDSCITSWHLILYPFLPQFPTITSLSSSCLSPYCPPSSLFFYSCSYIPLYKGSKNCPLDIFDCWRLVWVLTCAITW